MASDSRIEEDAKIQIAHPVFNFENVDNNLRVHRIMNPETRKSEGVVQRLRSALSNRCSGRCLKRLLLDRVPVIDHLRRYRWKQDFLLDLIAGLSGGVIHVPQGMGFALLAGLPPAYGLYTSFFPGLLYYIFGTSRHLSIGTMALTALMVGTVVSRELPLIRQTQNHDSSDATTVSLHSTLPANANYSTDYFFSNNGTSSSALDDSDVAISVSLAVSVTLIAGLFQLAMRLCRLGILATYMSAPFSGSFMVGAALQIMVTQLPFQLGVSITRPPATFQLPLTLYEVFRNIQNANVCAIVTSAVCIAFLVGMKEGVNERYKEKLKCPIPVELIVVIVATLTSHFAQLKSRYNLPIMGTLPTGFPRPTAPPLPNFTNYLADAAVLAIISFAVSITMAQLMGRRHRYEIDTNQEVLAYGIANTVSPFFGCFVSTQAPPRTMVHEAAGGRTQMTGCLSVILPLLVTLCIGPLFQSLPVCVLGCIVSCSLVALLKQFGDLRFIWKVSKYDFLVWMITFLSTSLVSITVGLVVGIGVSVFFIALRAQLAKGFRTTSAQNTEIYYCPPSGGDQDSDRSLEREFLRSGIYVFRYDCGEVCFVNAQNFKRQLYDEIDLNQSTVFNADEEEKIVEPLSKLNTFDPTEHHPAAASVNLDNTASLNEAVTNLDETLEPTLREEVMLDTSITQNFTSEVQLPPAFQSESPIEERRTTCDESRPRHVILDLTSVCYVDITGLNVFRQIAEDYKQAGIELASVLRNTNLRQQMNVFGLLGKSSNPDQEGGLMKVYPTVNDAVVAARHTRA